MNEMYFSKTKHNISKRTLVISNFIKKNSKDTMYKNHYRLYTNLTFFFIDHALRLWTSSRLTTRLFLFSDTLRALYMGDNDFEILPPEIGRLKNLQVVR